MKTFVAAALWCSLALSTVANNGNGGGQNPNQMQIKNLVTFGDSYTDVVVTGDGGVAWPVYAAGYAGVTLYPFARSGATCSNNITYRPSPSVFESQLPAYFGNQTQLNLSPEETIGSDNASLVDVTACMVNWVKVLYASGARKGLFTDMYQHPSLYLNGTGPLNVTGCVHSCIYAINESTTGIADCTITNGTAARDSFLWYDELHPSEQADRIVAREMAAVIDGQGSKWATWIS